MCFISYYYSALIHIYTMSGTAHCVQHKVLYKVHTRTHLPAYSWNGSFIFRLRLRSARYSCQGLFDLGLAPVLQLEFSKPSFLTPVYLFLGPTETRTHAAFVPGAPAYSESAQHLLDRLECATIASARTLSLRRIQPLQSLPIRIVKNLPIKKYCECYFNVEIRMGL